VTEPIVVVGAGQSGLAAARAVRDAGLRPLVLEASGSPAGSWPAYYDSLALFSPARYSALPGLPFPGGPDRYPCRDEVAGYLGRYADWLAVEIRTGTTVETIRPNGRGFVVHTAGGESLAATGVVAASGSFSNPHRPALRGQDHFAGELLHVADYRCPAAYAGKRVVVVGGGNSAIQVGYELAGVASVTLASRAPVRFLPQRPGGHDVHYWLTRTGFDELPGTWLARIAGGPLVVETGGYQEALASGRMDRRPMFTALDGDRIVWADGVRERVDVVLLATGYRPSVGYLEELGALSAEGLPEHTGGISTTHLGLVYVGLNFQRSFASNTLRGVSRDADHVVAALAALVHDAPATIGL